MGGLWHRAWRHYDYVVQAVYGTPAALSYGAEIDVPVDTANAEGDVHSVYFNRGAIPSQAFADKFGNVGPTDAEQNDPSNEKVKWLSRGLLEAVLAYIAQAKAQTTNCVSRLTSSTTRRSWRR